MLCLTLQPDQKSGMILPFEVVLKLKLPKNHFNKKCAPKILSLNEKKIRKIRMIFDIENPLWKSNFGTSRWGGKPRQSILGCLKLGRMADFVRPFEKLCLPKVTLPRLTTLPFILWIPTNLGSMFNSFHSLLSPGSEQSPLLRMAWLRMCWSMSQV